MENLTKEERNAMNSLKRLVKRWPKSLEFFSNNGRLEIRRSGWFEVEEWTPELIDEYLICTISDIPHNSGGNIDEKYIPGNTYCL